MACPLCSTAAVMESKSHTQTPFVFRLQVKEICRMEKPDSNRPPGGLLPVCLMAGLASSGCRWGFCPGRCSRFYTQTQADTHKHKLAAMAVEKMLGPPPPSSRCPLLCSRQQPVSLSCNQEGRRAEVRGRDAPPRALPFPKVGFQRHVFFFRRPRRHASGFRRRRRRRLP